MDTTRVVKHWREEYSQKGIPSSFRDDPSGSVVRFLEILEKGETAYMSVSLTGRALDLGCGTGRNSIYLADHGYEVYSIDFVPDLIADLQRRVEALGLAERVHAICQSVTDPWPFAPATFNLCIDTFCYKHQVTKEGQDTYRGELARVMKSGGFYLLTLAGVDDGYYGLSLATSPKPEENLIIDPANGIASILYSKATIEEQFGGSFDLVHYEHKAKSSTMHGATYNRSTHLFVFRRK